MLAARYEHKGAPACSRNLCPHTTPVRLFAEPCWTSLLCFVSELSQASWCGGHTCTSCACFAVPCRTSRLCALLAEPCWPSQCDGHTCTSCACFAVPARHHTCASSGEPCQDRPPDPRAEQVVLLDFDMGGPLSGQQVAPTPQRRAVMRARHMPKVASVMRAKHMLNVGIMSNPCMHSTCPRCEPSLDSLMPACLPSPAHGLAALHCKQLGWHPPTQTHTQTHTYKRIDRSTEELGLYKDKGTELGEGSLLKMEQRLVKYWVAQPASTFCYLSSPGCCSGLLMRLCGPPQHMDVTSCGSSQCGES
eukprot:scaffold15547_cov21-Tisochrysis_lutea.AAC.3